MVHSWLNNCLLKKKKTYNIFNGLSTNRIRYLYLIWHLLKMQTVGSLIPDGQSHILSVSFIIWNISRRINSKHGKLKKIEVACVIFYSYKTEDTLTAIEYEFPMFTDSLEIYPKKVGLC